MDQLENNTTTPVAPPQQGRVKQEKQTTIRRYFRLPPSTTAERASGVQCQAASRSSMKVGQWSRRTEEPRWVEVD